MKRHVTGASEALVIQAVVRVVADENDQIHSSILPGPVSKNRHLLDRTVA